MKYDSLIKSLREYTYWLGVSGKESRDIHPKICDEAAEALEEAKRFINYLDKKYSYMLPEDKEFDKWR